MVTKLQIDEVSGMDNRIMGSCYVNDSVVGFSLPIVGNGKSSFTPKPGLHYRDEIKKQVATKIQDLFNT